MTWRNNIYAMKPGPGRGIQTKVNYFVYSNSCSRLMKKTIEILMQGWRWIFFSFQSNITRSQSTNGTVTLKQAPEFWHMRSVTPWVCIMTLDLMDRTISNTTVLAIDVLESMDWWIMAQDLGLTNLAPAAKKTLWHGTTELWTSTAHFVWPVVSSIKCYLRS